MITILRGQTKKMPYILHS